MEQLEHRREYIASFFWIGPAYVSKWYKHFINYVCSSLQMWLLRALNKKGAGALSL